MRVVFSGAPVFFHRSQPAERVGTLSDGAMTFGEQLPVSCSSAGLQCSCEGFSCRHQSLDAELVGCPCLPLVGVAVDNSGSEEDVVEIYVWNERLGTYVLVPEDEQMADKVEGRVGAAHLSRPIFHHLALTDGLSPPNAPKSPIDHVLPSDSAFNDPFSSQPLLEQPPSLLPLGVSSLQPNALCLILEETGCCQPNYGDNYEFLSASSVGLPYSSQSCL